MIYQAINPVVCTILIICLQEKSDKYIILFLHCRFDMSLPQFLFFPLLLLLLLFLVSIPSESGGKSVTNME